MLAMVSAREDAPGRRRGTQVLLTTQRFPRERGPAGLHLCGDAA